MAEANEERATAAGIDVTVPSVARTYDYMLGGKDNFAVDRELAERILRFAPEVSAGTTESYKSASAPAAWRSREAIARFFTGLDLVDPGLVTFTDWRADDLEHRRPGGDCTWGLAGVGRKP